MDRDPDIERIVQKLGAVRARGLTCFGSEAHGFELAPPLDEPAVARFEAAVGARLPAGYRRFLTQAGAHGAGPAYGLLPLPAPTPHVVARCAPPCLLRPGLGLGLPRVPGVWLDAIGRPTDPYQGTLALVSEGGPGLAVLALHGPHAGRVVHVHDDPNPFPPHVADDEDFLGWYERWLDELLAGWDVTTFGHGLRGTEASFRAGAVDPSWPVEERARAVLALTCLPRLEPASVETVLRVLRDDRGTPRACAAEAAEQFTLVEATELLRAALDDPDPDARAHALRALTKLPGVAWIDDARRMARDPTRQVVFAALSALSHAGVVRVVDVAAALASPDRIVRRNACWALRDVDEPAARDALRARLDDAHEDVRIGAVQALGAHAKRDPAALGGTGIVAALCARFAIESDPTVALNLAIALGAARDTAALPTLLAAAAHPDGFVRGAVATALGELGDRRAIPVLEALERDTAFPREVGETARRALARLRGSLDA